MSPVVLPAQVDVRGNIILDDAARREIRLLVLRGDEEAPVTVHVTRREQVV